MPFTKWLSLDLLDNARKHLVALLTNFMVRITVGQQIKRNAGLKQVYFPIAHIVLYVVYTPSIQVN